MYGSSFESLLQRPYPFDPGWNQIWKYIALWELLAQSALTYCISPHIPASHPPLRCHQGCDNSAADATSAKGIITMTTGMSSVLSQYYLFMRKQHRYAEITHIPGRENVVADALSRFQTPSVELTKSSLVVVHWKNLLNQSGLHSFQSTATWPVTFSHTNCVLKMHVNEDRLGFGGVAPAGRVRLVLAFFLIHPSEPIWYRWRSADDLFVISVVTGCFHLWISWAHFCICLCHLHVLVSQCVTNPLHRSKTKRYSNCSLSCDIFVSCLVCDHRHHVNLET